MSAINATCRRAAGLILMTSSGEPSKRWARMPPFSRVYGSVGPISSRTKRRTVLPYRSRSSSNSPAQPGIGSAWVIPISRSTAPSPRPIPATFDALSCEMTLTGNYCPSQDGARPPLSSLPITLWPGPAASIQSQPFARWPLSGSSSGPPTPTTHNRIRQLTRATSRSPDSHFPM